MQLSLSRRQHKNSCGDGHHEYGRNSRQHMVKFVARASQLEVEPVTDIADLKEQKEGLDGARVIVVESGEIFVRKRVVG